MNKPVKTPPTFSSEAGERAFWETHDSSEYLDWSKASYSGRLQAVDANLVQRLEKLVGGIEVDLDAALSPDDE